MTHEVLNQPVPLHDYNAFSTDAALAEGVQREGAAADELPAFGARTGSEQVMRLGFEANENPPVLHTHDRYGNRRDEVSFHPSYHRLMELSVEAGIHAGPWASEVRRGAHVERIAKAYLVSQAEGAHVCPVSMTYSSVPALRRQADLAAVWEPLITRRAYDPSFQPAPLKRGTLIGMGMTEKQGGSDVRANTTRAVAGDGAYRVTGHKWFCSAPMCDGFLILAQLPEGLSCFLVPRWTPEGRKNTFHIQRLKNKLGNRANASSEVEFEQTFAQLVGEPGRGVATIIKMVNHTRLDCVMGSAAIVRQALVQAIHHCRGRRAFGALLVDQPLMRCVLADIAIESEAATALLLRLARAYDEGDRLFARLATAVSKYWVSKRAALLVGEALECLGGAGYVEESILPRLYREAPLNSIWEGSGNVIALDVMRAVTKEPGTLDAVMAEIDGSPEAGRAVRRVLDDGDRTAACYPRELAEALATGLQTSLLRRFAPAFVADAYVATRLRAERGHTLGTIRLGSEEATRMIDRAFPPL